MREIRELIPCLAYELPDGEDEMGEDSPAGRTDHEIPDEIGLV